jgi:Family of unknown function (DUF6084)
VSVHVQPPGIAARPGEAGDEDLRLEVRDVSAVRHTAAPTLRFELELTDPRGREIQVGVLSVQIHIDPAKRSYDDGTRAKLVELFGAPERWAATTQSFQWARVDAMVPGFTGSARVDLEVPCTYDLEVAASKYLYSLPDGIAPLSFFATGMLLSRGGAGQLEVMQVPWSCTARYDLPVDAWKDAIAAAYPGGGWVRLQTETLDALAARKAAGSHHSFDDCVRELLEKAP